MKSPQSIPAPASAQNNSATIAPIAAAEIGQPEWIRPGDARKIFGLGRTFCYGLIAEGKIRSVVLRKRGAKTGVRLLSVDSIRDFLHHAMERAEQ